MKTKLLNDGPQRTFAVVLDTGDEAAACLGAFARQEKLGGSQLTAIGALSDVVLGYFDWQTKKYRHIPVKEQVEVVALIGDVALDKGEPKLHAHLVVGKSDGTTMGGHLIEAHVRPTLEVIVTESPAHLRKRWDPETGLALIAL